MSDMRNYGCLRFKLKEGATWNSWYEYLRKRLGEPKQVEYKSEWVTSLKKFERTDEIEYFCYGHGADAYEIVCSDEGIFYLDYILYNELDDGDMSVKLSMGNLSDMVLSTREIFGDAIVGEPMLLLYNWYTGSEMPVDF